MKQYIYGKNPIMEALKGASVYKIYMLNGHKDPKIFDICKRNQIPLEFVDKKEFDKKVGKVVHQGVMAMKDHDVHSLSHTKWECKYHIVFAPKYRRKVFYGQKRYEIGQILRELCRWKQVNLLEAEACPDHIHILVEIPPKISVSNFMGFLKGKSSLMIYEKWGNMKYKYRNRSFWCRGYYVSTVGKNEKKITEYIQNQLKEDYMSEQLVLDMTDPFTGSRK